MSESSFLNLPGEIRNQIYSLLLCDIVPLGRVRVLGDPQPLYPQILCVCRQTNLEARQILYTKNTFIAHYSLLSGLPQLRRWHAPVKAAHLIALIRRYHIYVRLDCDAHFTSAAAKLCFTGVEHLTVEACQTQFGSSNFEVLRRFEKIRGVKRARVLGSVLAFPYYTGWLEDVMMSPEGTAVDEFEEGQKGSENEYDLWTVSSSA